MNHIHRFCPACQKAVIRDACRDGNGQLFHCQCLERLQFKQEPFCSVDPTPKPITYNPGNFIDNIPIAEGMGIDEFEKLLRANRWSEYSTK